MNRSYFLATVLSAWAMLMAVPAFAQTSVSREDRRLNTASQVLEELRDTPDSSVPAWLMQRAYGVAVIPSVIKAAFIFGGRAGDGVLVVRDSNNRFGNPIFIHMVGGSVGWQVGAASTDVVLIFVTRRSVENFARGNFTLGADASVAAGPLGRQGEAAAGISAEVYSYSRSRGLFAGVALDGTVLAFNNRANQFFYHDEYVNTEMITSGKVSQHSDAAHRFLQAVALSTQENSPTASDSTQAANPQAAPAANAPQAANASATTGGVKTYPIEDPHPGGEPK
jgi:lipid-binding SYLF domain-containing protein